MASLVEFGLVVLEKIFKFRQCIFAILLLFPLGKGDGPSFEQQLEPPHPRTDAFCQVWFEIGPVVLEKIFIISLMHFRYFVIISPLK